MKSSLFVLGVIIIAAMSLSIAQECPYDGFTKKTCEYCFTSKCVDIYNNKYVAGYSLNKGFPISSESSGFICNGFFVKYNAIGKNILSITLKGTQNRINTINFDEDSYIYITGIFYEGILEFNNNIFLVNNGDNCSAGFIAKFSSEGICVWARTIEGQAFDKTTYVCVDSNGSVYVSGRIVDIKSFANVNLNSELIRFSESINLRQNEKTGNHDAFIAKYNSEGVCQWGKYINGFEETNIKKIITDVDCNLYVMGTMSKAIEFSNRVYLEFQNIQSDNFARYFIGKFSKNGDCQWAKFAASGNKYIDSLNSLYIDKNDLIKIIGQAHEDYASLNNNERNRTDALAINCFEFSTTDLLRNKYAHIVEKIKLEIIRYIEIRNNAQSDNCTLLVSLRKMIKSYQNKAKSMRKQMLENKVFNEMSELEIWQP